MNAKTIERLAEEAKNPDELLRKLCEDINLTNGQKVYTVHGMGQSSVIGTFQGLTNGGMAKVKNPTGTYTVAAHLVFPKR